MVELEYNIRILSIRNPEIIRKHAPFFLLQWFFVQAQITIYPRMAYNPSAPRLTRVKNNT